MFTGKKPPSAADLAAGVIAGQANAVAVAAEGCDVLVAAGLTTATAGAQAVSEKRGIRYMYAAYAPCYLPSPYYPPLRLHGPAPPDVTDNRVLWELNAQGMNAVFGAPVNAYRASLGLSAVDNVRDYVSTGHPLLAADPTLAPWPRPAGFSVVQTGAWILPDERPLPEGLEAFLDALGIGVAHEGPVPAVESLSAALGTTLTPDARTSSRSSRRDPHRRGDGGREIATGGGHWLGLMAGLVEVFDEGAELADVAALVNGVAERLVAGDDRVAAVPGGVGSGFSQKTWPARWLTALSAPSQGSW